MYYAIGAGEKLIAGERLAWVKLQENGIYVRCEENEGQGVIIDDEIYHVSGKEKINKPTVDLIWENSVKKLIEVIETRAEQDEFIEGLMEGLGV